MLSARWWISQPGILGFAVGTHSLQCCLRFRKKGDYAKHQNGMFVKIDEDPDQQGMVWVTYKEGGRGYELATSPVTITKSEYHKA